MFAICELNIVLVGSVFLNCLVFSVVFLLDLPSFCDLCPIVGVVQSFVFFVAFCRSFFVLLVIVLSVLLQLTTSDYSFGIFQIFYLCPFLIIPRFSLRKVEDMTKGTMIQKDKQQSTKHYTEN
jgi:hypothetical protein